MQTFFTNYLSHLQELHGDIRSALKGLPPNALDWSPGHEINSLSVLVIHLTGAERYWIGDVIANDSSERDRDAEFKVQGLSEEILNRRLSENEEYISKVLEAFTLQELETIRTSPRNNREATVGWVLNHILKHTALHAGQTQIMRQLWEQRQSV